MEHLNYQLMRDYLLFDYRFNLWIKELLITAAVLLLAALIPWRLRPLFIVLLIFAVGGAITLGVLHVREQETFKRLQAEFWDELPKANNAFRDTLLHNLQIGSHVQAFKPLSSWHFSEASLQSPWNPHDLVLVRQPLRSEGTVALPNPTGLGASRIYA